MLCRAVSWIWFSSSCVSALVALPEFVFSFCILSLVGDVDRQGDTLFTVVVLRLLL